MLRTEILDEASLAITTSSSPTFTNHPPDGLRHIGSWTLRLLPPRQVHLNHRPKPQIRIQRFCRPRRIRRRGWANGYRYQVLTLAAPFETRPVERWPSAHMAFMAFKAR